MNAPYERSGAIVRQARTQRERDLEALGLAGRKGVMLAQLRDLAGNDRLDPAELPKLEWFADQVRAAAGGARLDDLAALFTEARIRPRRWWQPRPALTTGHDDEDDDTGDGYAADDDDDEDQDGEAAVLATPASIAAQQHRAQPQVTWAGAIAASGWRLGPATGGCAVTDNRTRLRCRGDADRRVGDGWICGMHYAALSRMITDHDRRTA